MLRSKNFFNLLILTIFAFVFSNFSYAGIVMDQVRYELSNASKKDKGLILMQSNKMLFKDLTNNISTLFDLNKDEMVIIDHNKKIYTVAKPEDFAKAAEDVAKKMQAEIEKHLENLPPEQRESVKKMMEKNGNFPMVQATNSSVISISNTGKAEKIAGYSSKKYEVFRDGNLDEEIWVSNEIGFQKEIDISKMSRLMKEFKKISKKFGGGDVTNEEAYIEIFEKGGFPMKTVDHSFGNAVYVEEVEKVTGRDISDSELEVPSDYKQKTLDSIIKGG